MSVNIAVRACAQDVQVTAQMYWAAVGPHHSVRHHAAETHQGLAFSGKTFRKFEHKMREAWVEGTNLQW